MAKVRINKLPEGYKIKGGKVVKSSLPNMSRTGDQSDFGLVTFTGNSNINGSSGPFSTVNKTLTAEPRDQANLEAEKGETVLTDMNNDGEFELYDITGKIVIRVKEEQLKSKITQLDVSQLASGLYNFVITYDGKSINKKVIKQ